MPPPAAGAGALRAQRLQAPGPRRSAPRPAPPRQTVYRGRWRGAAVAIVRMRKGGAMAEARLMAELRAHPNLVRFHRRARARPGARSRRGGRLARTRLNAPPTLPCRHLHAQPLPARAGAAPPRACAPRRRWAADGGGSEYAVLELAPMGGLDRALSRFGAMLRPSAKFEVGRARERFPSCALRAVRARARRRAAAGGA